MGNSSSALIHEFYGSECHPAEPIHLTIDTSLKDPSIHIKAFVSEANSVAKRSLANQFRQIPVQMESMEAEAIARE